MLWNTTRAAIMVLNSVEMAMGILLTAEERMLSAHPQRRAHIVLTDQIVAEDGGKEARSISDKSDGKVDPSGSLQEGNDRSAAGHETNVLLDRSGAAESKNEHGNIDEHADTPSYRAPSRRGSWAAAGQMRLGE